jgi:hypothetical protein
MKHEAYDGIRVSDDFAAFDFISLGTKGAIRKRIFFESIEPDDVYNLTLGDVDENGALDDSVVSNNGDRNTILATVVKVIEYYTKMFPDRWIFLTGNTEGRIRLYRMAVGLNLEDLSTRFEINALVNKEVVPFTKNLQINAFLIKRKNT